MCLNNRIHKYHPANHLRGREGRSRLTHLPGHPGVVVQPLGCSELPFPWYPTGRAITAVLSKTLSLRPRFPTPFLSDKRSFLVTEWRPPGASAAGSAAPRRHFRRQFTSWLGGWSRAGRARGRAAGQSPPGTPGISWRAGGRRKCSPGSHFAAPPPLSASPGRPGGRDNVAGLIAGRRPPGHLKWVPPGCCLAGRRGRGGGG